MLGLKLSDQNYKTALIFGLLTLGFLAGALIAVYGFSPLIAAVPFGILFFLLTVQRPWIALFLFFFLVPLENLLVFEGAFSGTITKLIGGYLIFLAILSGNFRYIPEVFKNKKTLWVVGFFFAAVISVLFSNYSSLLLGNLSRLLIFVIFFITLIVMIRDVTTLKYCFIALTIGAVLSVLSPIVLDFDAVKYASTDRYGGLWGDQNTFAAILITILPLSVVLYLNEKKKSFKLLYAAGFLVLLGGFILTYSRGGFIAFTLLAILTLFKLIQSKNRVKILAILIPVLILTSAIFYNTVADKIFSRVESLRALQTNTPNISESSLNRRYIYYFKIAPKIFAEDPILGTGLRGFVHYNTYYKQSSHNTYLEVLTGTGLVGFIPFLMILYLSWRELKRVQFATRYRQDLFFLHNLATTLELGLISILVCGLFIGLDMNKFLWLTIALSSVIANIFRLQIKREAAEPQLSYVG